MYHYITHMFCEAKSCVFVINPSRYFNVKQVLYIHIIAFSSEKVILSESREKYVQSKQFKTVFKQICVCILMWEDNRVYTLSAVSIIIYYGLVFGQKQWFKVKTPY